MLIAGLVSVTFRSKTPREICTLCREAQLSAVEWGADIHVPPTDLHRAREVRHMCADYGLMIPSYGSYYRVTQPMDELRRCMDAACELNADVVRIWCGTQGSHEAENERKYIVDSLLRCAEEARSRRLMLSLEYHTRTLTDERGSVQRLLQETQDFSDCLSFYWQPRFDWTQDECLDSLKDILPRLSNIHAFTWRGNDGKCRLPLESGHALWENALSILRQHEKCCVLLEFVQRDLTAAFMHDAQTLRVWLNKHQGGHTDD